METANTEPNPPANHEPNPPANGGTIDSTKPKRITNDQASDFFKFFNDHNFHRGSTLPRVGGLKDFDDLLKSNHISRDQAVRQFQNWKKHKYEYWGESYNDDPDELRELLEGHMPVEKTEFLQDLLKMMSPVKEGKLEKKLTYWNLAACLHRFHEIHHLLLEDPFKSIVLSIIDQYVSIGVDTFPEQAKLLKSEISNFYCAKTSMVKDKLGEFLNAVESFDFPEVLKDFKTLPKLKWRLFFYDLKEKIYYQWCRTSFMDGLFPIEIKLDNRVSDYALEILYYTAGFVLEGVHKSAKRMPETMAIRTVMHLKHSIGFQAADTAGLPTGITKAREKKKKLTYPSKQFFAFICLIETVFIMNATTSMMVAYSDGSLFDEIKNAIVENREIQGRFTKDLGLDEFSEKKATILLDYILTKFKDIRGRLFVNTIRGQKRKRSNWATREQVSTKVVCAQAKAGQRLASEVYAKKNSAANVDSNQGKKTGDGVISNVAVDLMYEEATKNILDPNNYVEDEASSDEDAN